MQKCKVVKYWQNFQQMSKDKNSFYFFGIQFAVNPSLYLFWPRFGEVLEMEKYA